MAAPTEGELNTQLQNAVALLDNYLEQQTIDADLDTLLQSLETDFAGQVTNGAEAFRSSAAAVIDRAQGVLSPILASYCQHLLNVPERDPQACLDRLYTYFVDNSKSVKERAFAFGTPTGDGGNTGDAIVRRLTEDENGFAIESQHADAKRATVIATAGTGAVKFEELLEYRGANAEVSLLGLKDASGKGSGQVLRGDSARAFSPRDSLILNAAFSNFSWATPPATGSPEAGVSGDTLSSWVIPDVDITKVTLDVDSVYQSLQGLTPTKITLGGNVKLTQSWATAGIQFNPNLPYYRQLAYRVNSGDPGVLKYRIGSKEISADLSLATPGVWTLLTPALDKDLWPVNFDEPNGTNEIELDTYVSGDVDVFGAVLVPMVRFDGSFYATLSGATQSALDDFYTWADSIASDSKIQRALWIAFGRYLPHDAAPTLADPA